MVTILRFKLSNKSMESINEFSRNNINSDRKLYKQNWNKWMENNNDLINEEMERMKKLGYNECVKDKMFKAGRYYYRKKNINKDEKKNINTENEERKNTVVESVVVESAVVESQKEKEKKNEVKKEVICGNEKRKYIKISPAILAIIDEHIHQNVNNKGYTPANGHKQFNEINETKLRVEMNNMKMDNDTFFQKIKKTYKNRYFIATKNV
jgi:hypothetical protein